MLEEVVKAKGGGKGYVRLDMESGERYSAWETIRDAEGKDKHNVAYDIAEICQPGYKVGLECVEKGKYKNLTFLKVLESGGVEGEERATQADDKWAIKDKSIAWQAHVRNAVMLISPTLEPGKPLTQGDIDRVIKAANAFREAE